jgi:MFS family permease
MTPTTTGSPDAAGGAWAAFKYRAFSVLWAASVIASIGTWMYNAACGWLMTNLSTDPRLVSLVQVANSLPMFLFAIPAGALTDIVNRRRLLIVAESSTTILSAIFAACVMLGLVTPTVLLLFMFVIAAATALGTPGWQAIVPQLVPRKYLMPAVAANGVGLNISRALGPALGGALTAVGGVVLPFWINAISNLATVGALLWWRPPPAPAQRTPAERFWRALRTARRYASNSRLLRATLVRTIAFLICASAYWALLPLVARRQIGGGPDLYGILLACIGVGALVGAALLPRLRKRFTPEAVMELATVATSAALVLFAVARGAAVGIAASVLAGVSWVMALTTLNVSAQVALPDWVRGRGLAIYVTTLFGAVSVGSIVWGQVAAAVGLPIAQFAAAALAVVAIPLVRRWGVETGAGVDLSPALSWPAPVTAQPIGPDRGPALVTVEYQIDPANRDAFLAAIESLEAARRRSGSYEWGVFEDTSREGRFVETFLTESWVEHLRQHERTTKHDLARQTAVARFDTRGEPRVTHFVGAQPKEVTPGE